MRRYSIFYIVLILRIETLECFFGESIIYTVYFVRGGALLSVVQQTLLFEFTVRVSYLITSKTSISVRANPICAVWSVRAGSDGRRPPLETRPSECAAGVSLSLTLSRLAVIALTVSTHIVLTTLLCNLRATRQMHHAASQNPRLS